MTRLGLNAARGETRVVVDGVEVRLCLTLGALAEIETMFDADGPRAVAERLAAASAADLLIVLAALARGGGHDLSTEDFARSSLEPRDAARAIRQAFAFAAFDEGVGAACEEHP